MDGVVLDPGGPGMGDRGDGMREPDEVAAIVRLRSLGWGIRRIARELGCSHMTVRHYVAQGGWVSYRGRGRRRKLAGLEDWVRSAFAGMPGMPMWCARSWPPRRGSP